MPKKQKPKVGLQLSKKELHDVALPKLTIDFSKYPELYNVVKRITMHSYLPFEHVIVNLISNGIDYGVNSCDMNRTVINLQEAQETSEPF